MLSLKRNLETLTFNFPKVEWISRHSDTVFGADYKELLASCQVDYLIHLVRLSFSLTVGRLQYIIAHNALVCEQLWHEPKSKYQGYFCQVYLIVQQYIFRRYQNIEKQET